MSAAPHEPALRLQPATMADARTLFHLYQFYLYECSDWESNDVEADGLFDASPEFVARYIHDPDKTALLLWVDDQLAGFVITEPSPTQSVRLPEFADFFLLKKYRGRGLGREVVRRLMVDPPTPWVVAVFTDDEDAERFWRRLFDTLPFASVREFSEADLPQFLLFAVNEPPVTG